MIPGAPYGLPVDGVESHGSFRVGGVECNRPESVTAIDNQMIVCATVPAVPVRPIMYTRIVRF